MMCPPRSPKLLDWSLFIRCNLVSYQRHFFFFVLLLYPTYSNSFHFLTFCHIHTLLLNLFSLNIDAIRTVNTQSLFSTHIYMIIEQCIKNIWHFWFLLIFSVLKLLHHRNDIRRIKRLSFYLTDSLHNLSLTERLGVSSLRSMKTISEFHKTTRHRSW